MVQALAEHLAEKIDDHLEDDPSIYGDKQLEDKVRLICWNWFSGGGTAAIAASRVMETLED
jgi:hypothetical protein